MDQSEVNALSPRKQMVSRGEEKRGKNLASFLCFQIREVTREREKREKARESLALHLPLPLPPQDVAWYFDVCYLIDVEHPS